MKTAILADLHITDFPGTVKQDVLDWTAAKLHETRPDLIVLIGDMTAMGTDCQNQRMFGFLNGLDIPWCSTPGNAELRTNRKNARQWIVAPPKGAPLLLVNSSDVIPTESDMKAMSALPSDARRLLCTHVPPGRWPEEMQNALKSAQKRRAITAVIAGHQHDDGDDRLRGLDPDKAAGGPPMFELWNNDSGDWHRSQIVMEEADIRTWPLAEREEFFSRFGVSAMNEPLETLQCAAELKIPHIELRHGSLGPLDENVLRVSIEKWRNRGGETLSMHLPNLTPGDDHGSLCAAVERALRLGCNRVTLHVPAVTAVDFPKYRNELLANFLERMAPLLDKSVDIGIENLHTYAGKEADAQRNYGCTISECREWIETLRNATGNPRIGFHFDIGHARNNPPFNSAENVSDYYAKLCPMANGCHFHQVNPAPSEGENGNHTPFTGLYEKFISLAGTFLAWRKGQFKLNPPIFLEIRGKGLGVDTYKKLRHLIIRGDGR